MAKKITFEIDVDESGAIQSINKLDDSVKDVGKSAEKAEKSTKGFGNTLKNLTKGLGVIGLLTAAFEVLREALGNNQKVIDALSTATTALGVAFNDLFSFLSNNVGNVIDFFKGIFENPKQALDDFADAIKNNIEVRIKALIKTFGLLGDTVSKIFEGDFAGALDTASEAAETYVDVLTGVEGTVDKVVDGVTDLVNATIDYTTETYNAAAAITQQAKSTRLLELQQTRLREQYDRDAERLRQIRDDETKTLEERIEANRKLGEVLNEQERLEQETVTRRIAALQFEQEQLGVTQERIEEIYALETELFAIQAQQEGFRSEQQREANALLKEQADIKQAAIDAELKAEQESADELAKIAKQKADAEAKEIERVAAIEETARKNSVDIAGDVAGAIGALANEGTEAAKAAGIASVAVDVAKGLTGALSGWASLGPFGIAGAVASSAAIVASGISSVKSILAVKSSSTSTGSNSGNVSASAAPSAATITAPQFSTAADTGTSQLASDINQQNEPVQAYVVSEKMTNQQQLDRQVEINTEF